MHMLIDLDQFSNSIGRGQAYERDQQLWVVIEDETRLRRSIRGLRDISFHKRRRE